MTFLQYYEEVKKLKAAMVIILDVISLDYCDRCIHVILLLEFAGGAHYHMCLSAMQAMDIIIMGSSAETISPSFECLICKW